MLRIYASLPKRSNDMFIWSQTNKNYHLYKVVDGLEVEQVVVRDVHTDAEIQTGIPEQTNI